LFGISKECGMGILYFSITDFTKMSLFCCKEKAGVKRGDNGSLDLLVLWL
jgi:hypothetical protein